MASNSKSFIFLVTALTLLLFISGTLAARMEPVDPKNLNIDQGVGQVVTAEEEGCEVVGEEECLVRRTLIAHTDYIYTHNKGH